MKKNTLCKILTLSLIASLSSATFAELAPPTSPQISVQLWSIKEAVSNDFEGTLKQLATMGFKGVEFAGNFGKYENDAAGLKKFLDTVGLKASGAHVSFNKFTPENFDKTVAFYKAINCQYLIIPLDKRAETIEGAKIVAQELTALEEKLKPLGLHTGYHNHKFEMVDQEGTTTWDIIAKNTPSSVALEQDVAWTEAAQKNPVDIVKKYPGRTIATHYKAVAPGQNSTENAIIGKDTTDWKSLIKANKNYGGTLWFVIEQEVYPEGMTPLQSVEASLKGLQHILADTKSKK